MKIFRDPKAAVEYLLDERWDDLTAEQKKVYKVVKTNLKHNSVSTDKMEQVIRELGGVVEKIIVLQK